MPADAFLAAEGLPAEVGALMSTRRGGVSRAPFDSLNLRPAGLTGPLGPRSAAPVTPGDSRNSATALRSFDGGVADDPAAIHENQRRFSAWLEGAQPVWLDQVHGTRVVRLGPQDLLPGRPFPQADASVTTARGVACTVLVADCLPVLLAATGGRAVGAAHAGWRGLAGGVVEATLAAVCEAAGCTPGEVSAWLGACIGPGAFEVGGEVREAFGPGAAGAFRPGPAAGQWWADLPALARQRLGAAGVERMAGGNWCTHSEATRFFSFRRDQVTGRHAASIWIR